MLYYNVGTGPGMAGQTMAGLLFFFFFFFFFSRLAQLGAIYAHLTCVLVPGLNSGRLAVYSCGCVKQYTGNFRFEVPFLQCNYLF